MAGRDWLIKRATAGWTGATGEMRAGSWALRLRGTALYGRPIEG